MQEIRDDDLGITPCYFVWRFDQFKLVLEVLLPLGLLGLCPFYSSAQFSEVLQRTYCHRMTSERCLRSWLWMTFRHMDKIPIIHSWAYPYHHNDNRIVLATHQSYPSRLSSERQTFSLGRTAALAAFNCPSVRLSCVIPVWPNPPVGVACTFLAPPGGKKLSLVLRLARPVTGWRGKVGLLGLEPGFPLLLLGVSSWVHREFRRRWNTDVIVIDYESLSHPEFGWDLSSAV